MGRFIIILLFGMSSSLNGFGQLKKFDELSNQMFFNIFVHKPDSLVFDFVNLVQKLEKLYKLRCTKVLVGEIPGVSKSRHCRAKF